MSTHVYGLTVNMLADASRAARTVDHAVTLVDDATRTIVVIDQRGRVTPRPEPSGRGTAGEAGHGSHDHGSRPPPGSRLARLRARSGRSRASAEVVELTAPRAGDGAPEVREGDRTWWADARCNDGSGRLAGIFFSQELQDIARAKLICATCPAMIACLEGALARREPWGVWGGQLFLDGRIQATRRRRGRPPKLPRAEDHMPDIPIPEHLHGVAVAQNA